MSILCEGANYHENQNMCSNKQDFSWKCWANIQDYAVLCPFGKKKIEICAQRTGVCGANFSRCPAPRMPGKAPPPWEPACVFRTSPSRRAVFVVPPSVNWRMANLDGTLPRAPKGGVWPEWFIKCKPSSGAGVDFELLFVKILTKSFSRGFKDFLGFLENECDFTTQNYCLYRRHFRLTPPPGRKKGPKGRKQYLGRSL